MKTEEFIKHLEHESIVKAIREAEQKTSGEIRVFVSRKSPKDPVATARRRFIALGMDQTQEHNGVLIYIAPRSRKFAIIGDSGIHARCGNRFWLELTTEMAGYFKHEDYTQGLVQAIRHASEALSKYFPRKPGDKNELSDEVAHD